MRLNIYDQLNGNSDKKQNTKKKQWNSYTKAKVKVRHRKQ